METYVDVLNTMREIRAQRDKAMESLIWEVLFETSISVVIVCKYAYEQTELYRYFGESEMLDRLGGKEIAVSGFSQAHNYLSSAQFSVRDFATAMAVRGDPAARGLLTRLNNKIRENQTI